MRKKHYLAGLKKKMFENLQKSFTQEDVFRTSEKILIIHSNIQDAISTLYSSAQPERNK